MNKEKQLAVEAALKTMWDKGFFSICTIDNIGEALNIAVRNHPDYKTLRLLHCINFNNMDPELLKALPSMLSNVLNVPDLVFGDKQGHQLTVLETPVAKKKRWFSLSWG